MLTNTNILTSPPLYAALFAFSAKERDTENGLSYFGSRYYSSDLSIWLSVDPMSDKYPSLSPFEHGELGFMNVGDELNEKWVPVNYDISDEYNANNIQNSGSTTYWSNSSSIRSLWNSADETQRNHALEQVPAYQGLPMGPCDNLSKERIQNCSYYLRPHNPR